MGGERSVFYLLMKMFVASAHAQLKASTKRLIVKVSTPPALGSGAEHSPTAGAPSDCWIEGLSAISKPEGPVAGPVAVPGGVLDVPCPVGGVPWEGERASGPRWGPGGHVTGSPQVHIKPSPWTWGRISPLESRAGWQCQLQGPLEHVCLGCAGRGESGLRAGRCLCIGGAEGRRAALGQSSLPSTRALLSPPWGQSTACGETVGESRALGLRGARHPASPTEPGSLTAGVCSQILRDTGVFEHTWRELELWLEHLHHPEEHRREAVLQFLERVSAARAQSGPGDPTRVGATAGVSEAPGPRAAWLPASCRRSLGLRDRRRLGAAYCPSRTCFSQTGGN